MIRKERYMVDKILPLIGSSKVIDLDGDKIKMRSVRLLNFKVHGIRCVGCGLEGEYFYKEKSHKRDGSYHLNLYGVRDGKEILMTRDHILSSAAGGDGTLENSQTMCQPCNSRKGDGLTKVPLKAVTLVEGIRTDYHSVRKGFRNIARAVERGVTLGDVNDLLLAVNKITCKHIQTVALKSIEGDIRDHDTHHRYFTPIGDRAIIVHDDRSDGFYIFDRVSGERLNIYFT